MLERVIEAYLTKKIKELNGRAYKWNSPGNVGVPDRIVMLPEARLAFVELKATGKKPTAMQEVQHRRIRDLGFQVFVLDSKTAVDEFLQVIGGGAK